MALLDVQRLTTHFHTRTGVVRAVDDLSFVLNEGTTLGIVGESGSGKSVAVYSLLGLVPSPPGRIERGVAWFDGHDLLDCPSKVLRGIRGRRISLIFQDPMTALNPYMRVGAQVSEPLRVHDGLSRQEAWDKATAALAEVGIPNPAQRMSEYPHEFSGGMRQRAMIAMALVTQPEILIADEPTTALDVTVQAQILELIRAEQKQRRMAMVLITHDLGVVAGTCDQVLVMYAGRALESTDTVSLFEKPRHPYTRALMDSLPSTRAKKGALVTIPGLPPDLVESLPGCPFAPRCAHAQAACNQGRPELVEVAPGHWSACVRVQAGEL